MLGIIFEKAQNKIQDPAKLRQLIVELIGKEHWLSMSADVKGDAYEGLLERNAQDVKGGAGQYFTPRSLIQAIVDCVQPAPGELIVDPACGTGGFLLAVWEPFPFVLAAGVTLAACATVIALVPEPPNSEREYERLRTFLAAPWRVVRRERNVRRFLVANTAWEATFAGMRTFVVLYIVDGLDQSLAVSSAVLGAVAVGYVAAAALSGLFSDRFGLGNVILGASWVYGLGLLVAVFAQQWHWWYYGLIVPVAMAGGTVMTLSWGLLYTIMPAGDRGTITGLATTTKGLGLVIGPLGAGAAIDIFSPFLESTDGYAALWPAVAVPVLAVIPLVTLLAEAEGKRRVRRKGSHPAA